MCQIGTLIRDDTIAATTTLPCWYPLNADLTNNQRVEIDRQTDAKTVPAKNNGLFDSKVFSQQRAEGWEENTKVRCYATTPFHGIIHV
jgi:hypothetical protein